MKKTNLMMIGLISFRTFAAVETTYLNKLNRARSAPELTRLHSEYLAMGENRMICKKQLDGHLIPTACYELLREEAAWKLTSRLKPEDLDGQCRAAVTRALKSDPESLEVDLHLLGANCRDLVEKGRSLERYRHPEALSTLVGSDLESAEPP